MAEGLTSPPGGGAAVGLEPPGLGWHPGSPPAGLWDLEQTTQTSESQSSRLKWGEEHQLRRPLGGS